jgi:hypothetical protein
VFRTAASHLLQEIVFRAVRISWQAGLPIIPIDSAAWPPHQPVFLSARVSARSAGQDYPRANDARGANKHLIFQFWLTMMGSQGRLLVAYDDVAGAEKRHRSGVGDSRKQHISFMSHSR